MAILLQQEWTHPETKAIYENIAIRVKNVNIIGYPTDRATATLSYYATQDQLDDGATPVYVEHMSIVGTQFQELFDKRYESVSEPNLEMNIIMYFQSLIPQLVPDPQDFENIEPFPEQEGQEPRMEQNYKTGTPEQAESCDEAGADQLFYIAINPGNKWNSTLYLSQDQANLNVAPSGWYYASGEFYREWVQVTEITGYWTGPQNPCGGPPPEDFATLEFQTNGNPNEIEIYMTNTEPVSSIHLIMKSPEAEFGQELNISSNYGGSVVDAGWMISSWFTEDEWAGGPTQALTMLTLTGAYIEPGDNVLLTTLVYDNTVEEYMDVTGFEPGRAANFATTNFSQPGADDTNFNWSLPEGQDPGDEQLNVLDVIQCLNVVGEGTNLQPLDNYPTRNMTDTGSFANAAVGCWLVLQAADWTANGTVGETNIEW